MRISRPTDEGLVRCARWVRRGARWAPRFVAVMGGKRDPGVLRGGVWLFVRGPPCFFGFRQWGRSLSRPFFVDRRPTLICFFGQLLFTDSLSFGVQR